MQRIVVIIICLFAALNLCAQSSKNEFSFQAKTSRTELSRGGTSRLDLNIQRPKRYYDSEMKLALGSGLPTGVQVTFDPASGAATEATASIAASDAAVPGTYNVVLNCTINNKTKGVIVKFVVLE